MNRLHYIVLLLLAFMAATCTTNATEDKESIPEIVGPALLVFYTDN